MQPYFARDYSGPPFQLFSAGHLLALGLVLAVNLWLGFSFRHWASPAARRAFRLTLAAAMVTQELGLHLWMWLTDQWSLQLMLPLHACSVLIWLGAVMLVTRNYTIYEFAYFIGIGGAIQALITPDAGIYGFPHYRAFQVMLSHGMLITAAIYMTVVEGFRPRLTSIFRVIIGINLYMVPVGIVNWLLGSNYLFIAYKPLTPSLIDVLGPWPWYILSLEGMGIATILLLYLPFALRRTDRVLSG